jgi:hypothetical protein
MLPWMNKSKNKMITTLLDARSGNKTQTNGDVETGDTEKDSGLRSACTELLNSIQRNSVPDMMEALKKVFQECDSQPHEEGTHTNEEEN